MSTITRFSEVDLNIMKELSDSLEEEGHLSPAKEIGMNFLGKENKKPSISMLQKQRVTTNHPKQGDLKRTQTVAAGIFRLSL